MYLEGTESITNGATSVSVVFASAFDTPPLHVQPFIRNTSADGTKRAIVALLTFVDEEGFTVQLSQATNSVNYELVWHAGDTASILNSGEPLQGQSLARALPAGPIAALQDFRLPVLTPGRLGRMTLRSLTPANFWHSIPFRAAIPSGPLAAGRDKSLNMAVDNNWFYIGLQDRWARIPIDNGMNWDSQPYFVPFREAEVDVTYVADQVEHTFAFPTPFSAGELPRVLFTLTNTAAGPIDLITATITEVTLSGFTLTFTAAPTADVQVYYMARQMRSNPSSGDAGSPENLVTALQDEVDALELVVGALEDAFDVLEADMVLLDPPTAASQAEAETGTEIALRGFSPLRVRQAADAAVSAVIDAAPSALNTLNELAAALGDDANFASTVTTALATKAPSASPNLTGTPLTPTAVPGTNTTQIASTAFVTAAVAAAGSGANLSATLSATNVVVVSDSGMDATIPAADATNAGVMTKAMFDKLTAIETAADVTDAANVGSSIHGATAKATLVDDDKFSIIDSEAANVLKTSLWSVIKSTLKTYFDAFYAPKANVISQALTSSVSITCDTSVAANATVTLAHNTTVTITNAVAGMSGTLRVTQDGTGSRTLSIASSIWAGGTPGVLSTAAGSKDVLSWCYDGTSFYCTLLKAFA